MKEKADKSEDTKKPMCPRCGRTLSLLEKDDGTTTLWCFWEQSPFLNNKITLGGIDDGVEPS